MDKPYTIGLDIGTNSVGWAVINDNLNLISKRMKVQGNTNRKAIKKNFWGVRLFDAGETAQATREKRTTRRRLRRRKQRLNELQAIFEEEIQKVDSNFFARREESFKVDEDKTFDAHPIFGNVAEEVEFYENYPTIYHLRKELADSHKKADIRLVYLALSHIIKYRGHFLIEGDLNTDNSSISATFDDFIIIYNEVFPENTVSVLTQEELSEFESVAREKSSRTRKFDQLLHFFPGEKRNGLFAQFLKMIVGNQANFKTILDLTEDAKVQFTKDTFEEDLEELLQASDETYFDVFIAAKSVYEAIELSSIIDSADATTNAKLSSQMVQYYDNHKDDLARYKEFVRVHLAEEFEETFNDATKNGYAGYIDGSTSQDDFYTYVKKQIKDIDGSDYFLNLIERELFLRKQRSFYNGVIPHQIHLEELRHILRKQGHHYPFLLENMDKIESLLTFRIPYYIGPLAKGQSEFAWIERKSNEKIKPWNFDEVVDRDKSAVKFIENLTNDDTYWPGEKVLPKRSLIYQQFTIFNELTKVTYSNDQGKYLNFSSEEKSDIFNHLIKTKSRVTEKALIQFLENHYNLDSPNIKGLDDGVFNANYSTYKDLIKVEGMKKLLDSEEYIDELEEIILILTVFEDRAMREKQLEQFSHLIDKKTIKKLSRKHYNGWGRLSRKVIDGIRDFESHKTILDFLKDDDGVPRNYNRNFMQLINDDTLSFKQQIHKAQQIDGGENIEDIVEELPGSPAIKRGILQSVKIVDEIVEIMGYKPSNIVIEMARENQTTDQGRRRSRPREAKLKVAINELGSSILKEYPTNNEALQKDRVYLYYLQNGKDIYTGEDLDFENLSNYDIDHIIPQSFITDNSIDNIVLTSSSANRGKLDDVPSQEIVARQKPYWNSLYKSGLMSERKFLNLTKAERGGLTDDDKARFIQRQLVETRQITKHVANILDTRFNTEKDEQGKTVRNTKIVLLKAALTSQFRREFELHKVREANDYHHGHDAYLNAVVATKLLKIYPKLAPEFVYGEYKHFNKYKANKATAQRQKMTNIMKSFKRELIVDDNGEIVWKIDRDIPTIRKVLSYHQMNFVRKVYEDQGMLFKETVNPKGPSDKLIPVKEGLDPEKYGGHIELKTAYFVAIKFIDTSKKRPKEAKRIIGIPIRDKEVFEENPVIYLESKGYSNAEVIASFKKNTLFEFEDGRRRVITSAPVYLSDNRGELNKANQMFFDTEATKFLYHLKRYDEVDHPASVSYVKNNKHMYKEILDSIEQFAMKYTLYDKHMIKIKEIFDNNISDNFDRMHNEFPKLLQINKAGAPTKVEFFGKVFPSKREQSLSNLWDAEIVYQSITGLYETRVNLEER